MYQVKKNPVDVEKDENMRGQAVHTDTEMLSDSASDYAFLGEVSTQITKAWSEKVILNGDAVNFEIDSGVDVTSIPENIYTILQSEMVS